MSTLNISYTPFSTIGSLLICTTINLLMVIFDNLKVEEWLWKKMHDLIYDYGE